MANTMYAENIRIISHHLKFITFSFNVKFEKASDTHSLNILYKNSVNKFLDDIFHEIAKYKFSMFNHLLSIYFSATFVVFRLLLQGRLGVRMNNLHDTLFLM